MALNGTVIVYYCNKALFSITITSILEIIKQSSIIYQKMVNIRFLLRFSDSKSCALPVSKALLKSANK